MHSIIISQKPMETTWTSSCFHWLLTDDDAVHRNVSNRYCKIKINPPVSLLQTQLTMRVISARSFGSLALNYGMHVGKSFSGQTAVALGSWRSYEARSFANL